MCLSWSLTREKTAARLFKLPRFIVLLPSAATVPCRLHKRGVHEPLAKRDRVEKHVWAANCDQPVNKDLPLLTESPDSPNRLAVILRRPRRILKHVRCPSTKSDGVCTLTKKITMFAQVMFNPTVPTDDISSTRGSSRPASWNLWMIRCR